MNKQLKEIFKSKENMEQSKLDFESLVRKYVEEHVDKNDHKSLDKAILELPECQTKRFVYQMMLRLRKKNK